MSKSIVPMPFVCKWSVAHPTTCRFKTREELIIHIDEHIINFYDKPADSVDSFYTCPWEAYRNYIKLLLYCILQDICISMLDKDHLSVDYTNIFSYRDVLVKGIVNEDKNMEDNAKDKSFEEYVSRWDQHQRKIQDLFNKGMEAIPFLPEKKVDHDLKLEDLSVDNLPESSQEVLSEYEHEVRGMKAFVEYHKGFIGR
ncbi:unnamed protein product [Rhizophagus irregularis]|nr:unnamed protein product [Rhizophagus irregularis]